MPQILFLKLVSQGAIAPQYLQGHFLQRLFFDLVEAVDPVLARVLRYDKNNCAYRLSALQIFFDSKVSNSKDSSSEESNIECSRNTYALADSQQIVQSLNGSFNDHLSAAISTLQFSTFQFSTLQYTCNTPLKPQTECWWRVVFLDDDLLDHLVFLWNQLGDETFQLGPARIRVVCASADAGVVEWTSSCRYQDIYEQASSCDRDIHLQFVTPTAFGQDYDAAALPTAEAIFQPLRKYWNRYSGLAFMPNLIDRITPTHFNIQSRPVRSLHQNSPQTVIGCTGSVSFRIDEQSDPLIVKRINTLADYTRYCGVGYNTRLGMGVIERLNAPAPSVI